jgi:hypothetical protein
MLRITYHAFLSIIKYRIHYSTNEDTMGRALVILLFGFAASFGILAYSKEHRMLDSVERVVGRVMNYSTKNTSASGAYMALNQLYQDPTWRAGYSGLYLDNDSLWVTVADNSVDATLKLHHVRIVASSQNGDSSFVTQVVVFDRAFHEFAVWAKGGVTNVTTADTLNNDDMSLLIAPAPYLPEINKIGLVDDATSQGQVQIGTEFHPNNNYPNGSFYSSGSIPNVTHVLGDMYVHNGRAIYGIYVVEGNVYMDPDGAVYGVLYLPNASSSVNHLGGGVDIGRIRGGVITWGTMDGGTNIIRVRHWPSYVQALASNYAQNNPPMRVIAWN